MSTFNMLQAAEALKTQYLPAVVHQLDFASDPFVSKVEKNGEDIVEGSQAQFLITSGMNGGIGNRADDGILPVASGRNAKKVTTVTKNFFATFDITSKVIKASQGKAGSFIQYLGEKMSTLTEDAKIHVARQHHGSTVGAITKLAVAPTATKSLTVVNGTNVVPGMRIDIITHPAGTVKASSILVDSVEGNAVTVDTNVTAAIDDILVTAGSYLLEITGLNDIFTANNTIYGVDRSIHKYFNAININGANAPYSGSVSDGLLQYALDQIDIRTGAKPDLIQVAYDVRRLYQDYYEATKRTVNSVEIHGGWKGIDFSGVPMLVSRYKEAGSADVLTCSTFKGHQLSDFDWMDQDGNILKHNGKTGYIAVLEKYYELACTKPGANARIVGITG